MSRGEKRGPSALEAWARQKTDGYDGVTIRNMTTSWRNGLAFCALIHRYRPDLIEYEKLDPCDILGNCSLAFEVAERQLGIPALLDPEDMAAHEIPDRLSVLTYVAQFYNTFKNIEKNSTVTSRLSLTPEDKVMKARLSDNSKSTSPEKIILKRTLDIEDEAMNEARKRIPSKSIMVNSANVCSECKNPVFISERVLFSKKLYHRSCFRCFNCHRVLNPHTADVSPDGLLFCLENACFLKSESKSSVREMINSRSKASLPEIKTAEDDTPVSESQENGMEYSDVLNSSQSKPSKTVDKIKSIPQTSSSKSDSERRLWFLENTCQVESDSVSREIIHPRSQSPLLEIRTEKLLLPDTESQEVEYLKEEIIHPMSHSLISQIETEKSKRPEPKPESHDNFDGHSDVLNPSQLAESGDANKSIPQTPTSGSPGTLRLRLKNGPDVESESESPVGETIYLRCPSPLQEIKSEKPESSDTELPTEEAIHLRSQSPLPEIKTDQPESSYPELRDSESPLGETIHPRSQSPLPVVKTVESDTPVSESHENTDENSDVLNPSQLPLHESTDANKPILQTPTPESLEIKRLTNENPVKGLLPLPPKVPESEEKSSPRSTPSPSPRKRGAPPPPPRPAQPKLTPKASTKEVWKKKNYYPAELNPFESEEQLPPETLSEAPKNPFEEDDENVENVPKPSPRIISRRGTGNVNSVCENYKLRSRSQSPIQQVQASPSPKPRSNLVRNTPIIEPESKPFNPFEDEENEEDESGVSLRAGDETSSTGSLLSDVSSFNSSISGAIHPVPKPRDRDLILSNVQETNSMRLRSRKNKRAPLPPSLTKPHENIPSRSETVSPSPIPVPRSPKSILKQSRTMLNPNLDLKSNGDSDTYERSGACSPSTKKLIQASPKLLKGLKNHSNQSMAQQYKKKRRAPAPPRRVVEPLPDAAIKTELEDLSVQQGELERQGITLESNIRKAMEEETNEDQVDEMMVQLWEIINEKNEILRRQTELEYLRRGHSLEEMQAELEFQLRILMDTPLDQRQEDHTYVENTLLEEMLKIVDERNEVVDWLDFHRKQDREEAARVSQSLTSFTTNRQSDPNESSQKPVALATFPRKSSKKKSKDKDKDKDKQSKPKKNGTKEKDKDKDKEKEDRKIKFGTLFGRKKNKGKKDKLDEDKNLEETLSINST